MMRVKLQETPVKARPVKALPEPSPSKNSIEKVDAALRKLGMTPKQKLAADYFLQSFNKYRAAIKAGYSESVANCADDNIFSVPAVREYINSKLGRRFRKEEFTADQVLMRLQTALDATILDYGDVTESGEFILDLSKVDRDLAANIQEIFIDAKGRQQVKLISKQWALEKKAQLLKMFEENQDGAGAETQPLTIQSLDAIVQKVTNNVTINNVTITNGGDTPPAQHALPKEGQLVLDAE